MNKLNILLVTYWFPPKESIASHRVYAIANLLAKRGNNVTVICPEWEGKLIYNTSQFSIINTHVISTDKYSELKRRKFYHRVKEFIFYKILKYNYFRDSKKGIFYDKFIQLNVNLDEFDFVITSYGPLEVLYIGEYIKTKNPNIKWCIDYRDYYSLNPYYNMGWSRNYFKKIEKRITKKSNGFITVSSALKENISSFLHKEGYVIYNGFTNENLSLINENVTFKNLKNEKYISYTGSLYNGKRDILTFLNFMKYKSIINIYNLVFCLTNLEDEIYLRNCLKKTNITNFTILKNLSYGESLYISKHAEYLLLLADYDKRSNGFLTGKFYEYMMFEKPIVYSGLKNNYELYQIIQKYNLGEHFESFDFTNGKKTYHYKQIDLPFSHENQISNLNEIIRNKF